MFDELVEYIAEKYSRAGKIVEIGVGYRADVARRIVEALPLADVVVTDTDNEPLRGVSTGRLRGVADDVRFPQKSIYDDAALIYSIHPPAEIVSAMVNLAVRVAADLLVAPIMDEQESFHEGKWERIVRKGRTIGWLLPSRNASASNSK